RPFTNFLFTPGGGIEQSGGTNNPTSLTMSLGFYDITNGVLRTPTMALITNTWAGGLYAGDFEQDGGYVTNGALTMIGGRGEGFHGQEMIAPAKYYLYGGTLETPSISMNFGNFTAGGLGRGATNMVGTLSMDAASIYA